MIIDHIKYLENIDHETGDIEVHAIYTVDLSEVIDPRTYEETEKTVKIKLAKEIQKEMIKNLSGFFHDSFNEEDIAYIITMDHKTLDDMRKLEELTKGMKIEDVKKILYAYGALRELGMFGKEKNGR